MVGFIRLGLNAIRALGDDKFVMLEAAVGSLGVYGGDRGTVDDFLDAQKVGPHLDANASYAARLPIYRERIAATVNFESNPAARGSGAARSAKRWPSPGYDSESADRCDFRSRWARNARAPSMPRLSQRNIEALTEMIRRESNPIFWLRPP